MFCQYGLNVRNLYACRTLADINDNSISYQLVEQQSADAVLTFMCVLIAVFGAVLPPCRMDKNVSL